jgi:hypothetical protein
MKGKVYQLTGAASPPAACALKFMNTFISSASEPASGCRSLNARTSSVRVPLWLKLAFTAFMAVLVPVYWHDYGPTNFLYFCDVALFLTLAALWLESPLLAGMAAAGILMPQALWVVDFGAHLFGFKLTGMTDYMFDSNRSLFLRGLSSFHGWLPFLLVFLVKRLGYDRRGFKLWTGLAWALMLACYFFMPKPVDPVAGPNVPVNINYVYGLSDTAPQTWMPAPAWLLFLMTALPLLFFWPAHLMLKRFFAKAGNAQGDCAKCSATRALSCPTSSASMNS